MRLLIVGSDRVYSIENFYIKHLRNLNVDVKLYPAQRNFYDYYQNSIFNKISYRLGFSSILEKINAEFILTINQFKPDAIWIFKGMEIFPKSLVWAKNMGIKLINFNADNPFLFTGKGSGNINVTESIKHYDLHLTYDHSIKNEILNRYKIRTEILPFGFDIEESLYDECSNLDEVNRACFLGNPDSKRGIFLQKLLNNGIELDLYGNDWEKFVKHPKVNIYPPVYADDCWRVLRKYRVQLNMMRPHNPDSHNMRTFELAGIGAIQLAPLTYDHLQYFTQDKEIFLYKDIQDCVIQINKLLNLKKPEAELVRLNARNRALNSGYSYDSRSLQALNFIKKSLE